MEQTMDFFKCDECGGVGNFGNGTTCEPCLRKETVEVPPVDKDIADVIKWLTTEKLHICTLDNDTLIMLYEFYNSRAKHISGELSLRYAHQTSTD